MIYLMSTTFFLQKISRNMSVRVTDIGENTKLAREMSLLGNYETARNIFKHRILNGRVRRKDYILDNLFFVTITSEC